MLRQERKKAEAHTALKQSPRERQNWTLKSIDCFLQKADIIQKPRQQEISGLIELIMRATKRKYQRGSVRKNW